MAPSATWILLLSLCSPLVEAFPNLYMSWWAPSNGNIRRYLDTWPRRVGVVLVVWVPILITVGRISDAVVAPLIGVFVFAAFGLRLRVFDRYLTDELEGRANPVPLSVLPEVFYVVAFAAIGVVLFGAVPDRPWLVPAAIATIWTGAWGMSTFRRGERENLIADVASRGVFVLGFLANLFNLIRAAGV